MSSGRPLSCTYSNLLNDFSSHLSHRFFHFLKPGTDDRFALLNGDHATRELTAVPAGQVRRMVAIAWTEGHLRGACQVPPPGSG
jgi:hypothetical protein